MAALLVIAAVALGLAIHLKDGEYTPVALALVTLAMVASILALVRKCRLPIADCRVKGTGRAPPFGNRQSAIRIVSLGLTLQLGLLFSAWPGADLPHHGGWQMLPFYAGLSVAVVLVAVGLLVNSKPARATWFPLLLLVHLLLGTWMVHSSPSPQIDVWMFQQKAAAELLRGHNPYAMTFPDIYHSTLPGRQQVYGDGLVVNDRLQFGFPYPPVTLLLATIGYAVAGDCRYAQVVALVLAGVFIGYCRPGRVAKLAAALLLFTPRVFYVLGRGWTEPFGILLLAATIFCACRRSRLLPTALGLLLATKQYMILAVPLTFFLLPRSNSSSWTPERRKDWVNLLWKAALAAAIITLPLALWDFGAFWKSTIAVQELAPFRWDALSYLVLYGKARANFHALDFPIWFVSRKLTVTDPLTAVIWSTSAAIVMLIFSLRRAPRTPAGFAASLALISLAFFAFNKQAFCNYYFFVIGAMCCAIACAVQEQKRLTTENTEDTERMPEINGPQMNTDEHGWK